MYTTTLTISTSLVLYLYMDIRNIKWMNEYWPNCMLPYVTRPYRTVHWTSCSVSPGTQWGFMDRSVINWKEEMVKRWSRHLSYHPRVENCTLLGYYTASCGNFLLTFRDNLAVPSSGFKNPKDSRNVGKN